jgi:hypothetical protein
MNIQVPALNTITNITTTTDLVFSIWKQMEYSMRLGYFYTTFFYDFTNINEEHKRELIYIFKYKGYTVEIKDNNKVIIKWNETKDEVYDNSFRVFIKETSLPILDNILFSSQLAKNSKWWYDYYLNSFVLSCSSIILDAVRKELEQNQLVIQDCFTMNTLLHPQEEQKNEIISKLCQLFSLEKGYDIKELEWADNINGFYIHMNLIKS